MKSCLSYCRKTGIKCNFVDYFGDFLEKKGDSC